MPAAFGLGFQNNFHLLSVNQWQPWELRVKAPERQPPLTLRSWAFWDSRSSFLGLHAPSRMGLESAVISESSQRDLRS